MSLTTTENESIAVSQPRQLVCLEAIWEIESLGFALSDLASSKLMGDMGSEYLVRGYAARLVQPARALMMGFGDDCVDVNELERNVLVKKFSSEGF